MKNKYTRNQIVNLLSDLCDKHANLKDNNWTLFLQRMFLVKQRLLAKAEPTPPVSEEKEKQIRENFAIQLTVDTTSWAMKHNQVVGENREYFITLRQLESFLNMQLEQPIKSSDIYEQHK